MGISSPEIFVPVRMVFMKGRSPMPTEAVIAKLNYLETCLLQGSLRGIEDSEVLHLLEYLKEETLKTSDEQQALSNHMVRFIETFILLKKYANINKQKSIVETGYLSKLSRFMKQNEYNVTPCLGDFRYNLDMESASADILLALEVFEHIKDQDSNKISDIDIFNFSGIDQFLRECRRLLSKEGILVITTPNACSLYSISKIFNYQNPIIFYPHVKEYAPEDVIQSCSRNGLKLLNFETFFAYYFLGAERQKFIEKYITRAGFSAKDRGDCSFFIFCRDDAVDLVAKSTVFIGQ